MMMNNSSHEKGSALSEKKVERFDAEKIRHFFQSVFRLAKVRDDVAQQVAEGLISTSLRGVDSHGIRLFPHYIAGVEGGRINPDPKYKFEKTAYSTGSFDADHTFGHAAGIEAMHKAMDLAQQAGAGLVAVFNSSHNGAMAYFALEAAKNDLIGLAFTQADSLINTPGSTRAFFGTNPVCMAVPCEGEEPFCYDSAPSFITWNRVRQYREEDKEVPPGIIVDANGNETMNPHEATQLFPIGGYKGFGLAMVVDILCGLLTGMPVGRDISNMFKDPISQKRFLGQFYMAIRIDAFQPLKLFKERTKKMMDDIRSEPLKDENSKVMVPGDPEKRNFADRIKNGIPLKEHDLQAFRAVAERYKIDFFNK
jgi:LDH2 family malate/lactate/ureidoglycolate dehydrogenase